MTDKTGHDVQAIDDVIKTFFQAFDNRGGKHPALETLRALCIAECVIVRTCGGTPEIYQLDSFIKPREALLNNGDLTEFHEQEIRSRTDVFGDIAQRFCTYKKSGVLESERFSTNGMKSIQLVRTNSGWKISAIAWDDEREGLRVLSPDIFD